jgi:acetyltransferase EpsM
VDSSETSGKAEHPGALVIRRELVVIGGGEHARVLIEAALSRPEHWHVLGFADPLPCEDTVLRLGVPHLGDDDEALRRHPGAAFIVAVGEIGPSVIRRRIVERYRSAGAAFASVVHAGAQISTTAVIGEGAAIFAGAVVNSGARIGDHTVVNTGAVIEHDVVLGPFAQVGPRSAVGGGASIGDGAYLGLGSLVRDHVRVGADAFVGLGAAVVADVEAGARVMGVPARQRIRG